LPVARRAGAGHIGFGGGGLSCSGWGAGGSAAAPALGLGGPDVFPREPARPVGLAELCREQEDLLAVGLAAKPLG